MTDPAKSIFVRERVGQVIAIAVIVALALASAILVVWPPTYVTDGRLVEATVVRTGTYPAAEVSGGDLPILTVRLPDGSVRQVRPSWAAAGNCVPGSHISLRQRGIALQVGLSGCRRATRSH